MTLVLCENDFNKQIDAFPCHFTNIPIEDVLIVETINKPLTFAETHLLQRTIKQWCTFTANKKLLRLCFTKWKIHQKNIKSNTTESTTKKIDNLISELHKQKLKKRQKSNLVPSDKPPEKRRRSFTECFENRFKTQKDIIEMQKNKLEQQTRIIEDLKLGIIRDELSQSLETTKTKLSEIFGKCSQKMKCKTAPTGVAFEDTLATLVMNSNKTPKFVQQMERRALERAKNREIIRERKRLIDEEKKRLFEAAVEQKRMQDEEEKRRNLEAVKEKQRAELERQKLMQINKERYLANLKKADSFYRMKIVWRCFGRLQHNVYISENNMLKAEAFQERKLKKNVFVNWTSFIQEKYREQNEKADETFRNNILSRSMQLWKNVSFQF